MSSPATSRALPALAALLLVMLAACESIGYYGHLARGQLELVTGRERVTALIRELDEAGPDAALRARLLESRAVLEFAEEALELDVGGRYGSYVQLDRDAVVWNLFAAPALSLTPRSWCHPFVGCTPYRGYFSPGLARRDRERLADEGWDTYLGPVAAFSTLGWFDDPLLSTFVDLPEPEFVELLFHELAHSRLWIRGDVALNESFASFVGRKGLERWLAGQERTEEFREHQAERRAWSAVMRLLARARDGLQVLYARDMPAAEMQERKTALLNDIADCLLERGAATASSGYERIARSLNNAYLVSLATYSDRVGAFEALFARSGGDWGEFYARAKALGALAPEERQEALDRLGEEHIATAGDDDGADEIQCEALARHGLDAEASGAVHDHVGSGGDG